MPNNNIKLLQKKMEMAAILIPQKVLGIMETETRNFIKKNFRDEGFNDNGINKWKPRKTTDREGRDLTRYRTNRQGNAGGLNKFGHKNINRSILIGHNTAGDKLANSFRVRRGKLNIKFYTYKKYAQRHNEGLKGMPRRQFIGNSKYLVDKIAKKTAKELDKIFK